MSAPAALVGPEIAESVVVVAVAAAVAVVATRGGAAWLTALVAPSVSPRNGWTDAARWEK